MAPSKRRGPLTRDAGSGSQNPERLPGAFDLQNTALPFSPQEFCAAIFGSQFRLTPDMAQVVAGLALGEVGR